MSPAVQVASDGDRSPSARRRHEPLKAALNALLLLFVYYMVAAASFSGYFGKWAFKDESPRASLEAISKGEAHRPFVYRQLVPKLVGAAIDAMPTVVQSALTAALATGLAPDRTFAKAQGIKQRGFGLNYLVTYFVTFFAWFAALLALRRVALDAGFSSPSATAAPLLFAVVFPLLLTGGGYFYDFPELLFFAIALVLAVRKRILLLSVVAVLGTLNKESFTFFVIALYPLVAMRLGAMRGGVVIALLCLLSAAVNLTVKLAYLESPGGMVEFQLWEKLEFLANPSHFALIEVNYGLITTRGFNVVHVALLAHLSVLAFPRLPMALRRHAALALAVNLPLFVLFSWGDELRNLSFLFPSFVLLIAAGLDRWCGKPSCVDSPMIGVAR